MATNTQTYGVTLPIMHGPQGYFAQSYTLLDQIKSNLNLLLRTKKGERRMSPEFGSGLWNVLFENYTDDIKPIIDSTIRRDISRWMGYVNVKEVVVEVADDELPDKNALRVSVTFTVPSAGVNRPQTLNLSMNTNNI